MGLFTDIIESWTNEEGTVNNTADLLDWITELNKTTFVKVTECSINDSAFWFYDDYNGEILNRKRSFFSIKGVRRFENGEFIDEQPLIFQPEIGYLGIVCRKINGVLNFLMQAKIEPGNVNCVQISPTIQATKSNFTRAHGGKLPTYFELFEHSERYQIIYDQIQSEQASRFYKKRNRNMIIMINEEFEVYPNFRWMTLGQIKQLMRIDNLVNMDTRTVLSGLPLWEAAMSEERKGEIERIFRDKALFNSIMNAELQEYLPQIFHKLNNYKMFHDIKLVPVPLNQLIDWHVNENGVSCKKQADFTVRYFDIEISGREVQHWSQPLIKPTGKATFGLITTVAKNKRLFLIKIRPEIGSFDKIELGPSVQWESIHHFDANDPVESIFLKHCENHKGIMVDTVLSEEGGRFYHEQNRNVILEADYDEFGELPEDYIWADYASLNYLVQMNNCMNIQLRNLMSLISL